MGAVVVQAGGQLCSTAQLPQSDDGRESRKKRRRDATSKEKGTS